MKVSEMINALQGCLNNAGDLEVTITDGFECILYRGDYSFQVFTEDDGEKVIDIGVGGLRLE